MASQITANIIKNGEPVDILYGRLSQEDDHAGDSNSIVNQRSYLEKYAADNGFQNPVFMADDGYSGTNFDRPAWQDIVTLIEAGLVRTLIVKDMSRLGREYLKVGELTELYFPSKGVRFIAVNDGVDSLVESSSDFNPIRNWANELHAKDTSRKVRSVKRMQAENGERLGGKPPYGYRKRDDDSKRLVPDEETKGVVQRIFKLCAEGKGPNQIARILRDDHVLNPTNQYYQQTGVACTRLDTTRPYNWCGATVANILSNPVYLGHTLNMQSRTLSYKNKQIFHRPPEEQVLVKNTHEAIIDQESWDTVQRVREHKRRPPKHMDAPGLFAGLVYCTDCGGYMVLCRTGKMKPEQYYFRCSTYGKRGKDACTPHHITEANLNAIVLDDLRRVTHFARTKKHQFAAYINRKNTAQLRKEMTATQRELDKMVKLEQNMIFNIGQLEKKREEEVAKLCKALELNSSRINISELMQGLQPEQKKELENVQERLRGILSELKAVNDVNGQLLEQSLEYIDYSINLLAGAGMETGSLYEDIGKNKGKQADKNIFDTKV